MKKINIWLSPGMLATIYAAAMEELSEEVNVSIRHDGVRINYQLHDYDELLGLKDEVFEKDLLKPFSTVTPIISIDSEGTNEIVKVNVSIQK